MDRIDAQILDLLQREGRLTVAELAERVSLSQSPCARRLKRLEDCGLIAGYRAVLDRQALQLGSTVFVNVRLNLAPMANIQKLQAREPFFRDALVRAGHRAPFTGKKDFVSLDEARLKAVMLKEAVRLGGKDVQGVAVMSQTAKRQSGLPKHPGA